MVWVEIVGIAVVFFLLLGLAGGFMARAVTSANLAQFVNAGRLLRGIRRPASWMSDGLRGELGSRDEERPPDERSR
jgi:hypothetical protein